MRGPARGPLGAQEGARFVRSCPAVPASRRPWVNPRGREGDRQRECGRRVSGRGCTSGFSACRQGWEKEGPGDPIIQARGDDGGLMSRGIQVATRDGGI